MYILHLHNTTTMISSFLLLVLCLAYLSIQDARLVRMLWCVAAIPTQMG